MSVLHRATCLVACLPLLAVLAAGEPAPGPAPEVKPATKPVPPPAQVPAPGPKVADAMAEPPGDEADEKPEDEKPEDEKTPEEKEMEKAKFQLERLQFENSLREAKTVHSMGEVLERKQRLETEVAVLQQQVLLRQQQREMELAEIQHQRGKIEAQNALATEQQKAEMAKFQAELDKVNLENQRVQAELARQENENKKTEMARAQELAALQFQNQKLTSTFELQNHDQTAIGAKITLRETKENYEKGLDGDVPDTPAFKDGVLTISDRRIPLNEVIISGTADFVCERLDFFNNKSSEKPIFIVIDTNYGGSVMEGYRITKAIEASKAPVHVVCKSFAASMAAVILTIAPHSYAYPNAIILHHQPSGMAWGNLTQQAEQLEVFKEWARRLHTAVAKKMGVSLEDFYKEMYKKNSNGDWQEFADSAQKLKWVDTVVHEIREAGVRKKPEGEPPRFFWFWAGAEAEAQAHVKPRYCQLPTPGAFDYYFLYNPKGVYRWVE